MPNALLTSGAAWMYLAVSLSEYYWNRLPTAFRQQDITYLRQTLAKYNLTTDCVCSTADTGYPLTIVFGLA
jgi:hypothetical protein